MATAGSKEARQLERVKRTFEKVYQNNEAKLAQKQVLVFKQIRMVINMSKLILTKTYLKVKVYQNKTKSLKNIY